MFDGPVFATMHSAMRDGSRSRQMANLKYEIAEGDLVQMFEPPHSSQNRA